MQLGFVLLLAAISIGMVAAIMEIAQPKISWALSVVCGLFFFGAAYDLGYNPQGMERAWGRAAANVVPLFLWGAGIFIELVCLWWLAACAYKWLSSK